MYRSSITIVEFADQLYPVFKVPTTHDVLSALFHPSHPKSHFDLLNLALLGLQILLFLYLPGRVSKPFFFCYFVFWRTAYDAGLGWVLTKQSKRRWIVREVQRRGWLDQEKRPLVREWIKKQLVGKMGKDYSFDVRSLPRSSPCMFLKFTRIYPSNTIPGFCSGKSWTSFCLSTLSYLLRQPRTDMTCSQVISCRTACSRLLAFVSQRACPLGCMWQGTLILLWPMQSNHTFSQVARWDSPDLVQPMGKDRGSRCRQRLWLVLGRRVFPTWRSRVRWRVRVRTPSHVLCWWVETMNPGTHQLTFTRVRRILWSVSDLRELCCPLRQHCRPCGSIRFFAILRKPS